MRGALSVLLVCTLMLQGCLSGITGVIDEAVPELSLIHI